ARRAGAAGGRAGRPGGARVRAGYRAAGAAGAGRRIGARCGLGSSDRSTRVRRGRAGTRLRGRSAGCGRADRTAGPAGSGLLPGARAGGTGGIPEGACGGIPGGGGAALRGRSAGGRGVRGGLGRAAGGGRLRRGGGVRAVPRVRGAHAGLPGRRVKAQASETVSARVRRGFQPSSVRARSLEAMTTAGSPARRGPSSTGTGRPVTRRTASSTSRTVEPL